MNHKLKNLWDVSMKLFFKNVSTIESEESLHVGSELHPPMYSMIEWMDDINLTYSNKYILGNETLYRFLYPNYF